ncbi:hypothetical protein BDV95DRAFT_179312 [Massariosphaeria phaeospora]|uniref:Secreted protein n=1 Tax=Massariosphaeria phaeospora TaxID=100035 RepID=A0A7C8I0H7_9PLEO|nr:hypothetical protein BDV95DRAFT_179312 [Massariosphaeria phaeospora]
MTYQRAPAALLWRALASTGGACSPTPKQSSFPRFLACRTAAAFRKCAVTPSRRYAACCVVGPSTSCCGNKRVCVPAVPRRDRRRLQSAPAPEIVERSHNSHVHKPTRPHAPALFRSGTAPDCRIKSPEPPRPSAHLHS